MSHVRAIAVVGCMLATILVVPRAVSAQGLPLDDDGFLVVPPTAQLGEGGGRSVNIIGNPREPGIYLQQITWAPGTGSRPHIHDQDRYIHVIKGTWYVSTGEAARVYDPDSTVPIGAGTFVFEPANGIHYDMAKDEEVIVHIMGMGPVSTESLPQEETAAGGR